jgi:addiction module RelE/StbE family toxin
LWRIIETKLAAKQFKQLTLENQRRYLSAIEELSNATDATKLGQRKHGRLEYCYAYEIGKSVRLLYVVIWDLRIIELLRVGSHKEVYGKD